MGNDISNLKDETLAQLQALRSTLTSDQWQIQMMSASAEQKQQNSDLQNPRRRPHRPARGRSARPDRAADRRERGRKLSDAIAGLKDALGDIQDIGKVLSAATTLLKIVGKVVALMARSILGRRLG